MRLAVLTKNGLDNEGDTSDSETLTPTPSSHSYGLRRRAKPPTCQIIKTTPIRLTSRNNTSPGDGTKRKARTRINARTGAATGAGKITVSKNPGTRMKTATKIVTRTSVTTKRKLPNNVKTSKSTFIQVPLQVGKKMKKAYKCVPCGKIFRYKSLIERHLFVHSGAKPIKCPDCPGRFSRQDLLNRHMQTHSGRKPYQCTNCFMWFLYRWQLTQHAQRHFGYKPFICATCKKRFTTAGELRQHNFTHAIKRPFKCSRKGCTKNYKDPRSLTRHIKRTHI